MMMMKTWKIEQGGSQDFYPYVPNTAREVEMKDQTDYGLRCIIINDAPASIEVTRELQLAAAREWLRRYPKPDRYRSRWASYVDMTVVDWHRKGFLAIDDE
jgi:hypothetical protein